MQPNYLQVLLFAKQNKGREILCVTTHREVGLTTKLRKCIEFFKVIFRSLELYKFGLCFETSILKVNVCWDLRYKLKIAFQIPKLLSK